MAEKFKTTGVGKGSATRTSNWQKWRDNMDYIKRNSSKKKNKKKTLKKVDKSSPMH